MNEFEDGSADLHQHAHPHGGRSWLRSRTGAVLLGFLVVAGFFLLTEHTAHVFGILPFALLLACLFMHLFMHGGHGGHGSSSDGPVRTHHDE